MSGKYQVTKNIFFNFAGQIFLLLLGFLVTPFIIRSLGNDFYGILSVVTTIVGYFSLLDFGLGVSIIKYISEYKAKEDKLTLEKIIGTALTVYILIGFLGGVSIVLFSKTILSNFIKIPVEILPVAITVFYVSALNFFINMVLTVFNAVPNAWQRMDISNSRNILVGLLNSLGTVIILALGYGIIGVVIWNVLVSMIAAIIFYSVIKEITNGISLLPRFNKKIFLKLIKFGGFKFLANLGGQIVFQLDRVLISVFHPIAAVTFYTAPSNLVQKGLSLIVNISNAVFPALSESYSLKDYERTKQLYFRMSKLIIFIVFPIMALLFIFSENILQLWLGADFAFRSSLTLKILSVAYFIAAMSAPGVLVSDAFGKPELPATFALISGVINLTAALILIPKLGIEGAAWAMLINFVAQVPVFLIIVHKKIVMVNNFDVFKEVLIKPVSTGLCAGFIAYYMASMIDNIFMSLFSGFVIFGLVYLVGNLLLGTFDKNDKMTFWFFVKKGITFLGRK